MIVEKAKEIKGLLVKNKIDEAFRLLHELQNHTENKYIRQSLVVLNASYNRLKEGSIKGVLTHDKYNIDLNKIVDSTIQLVDLMIEDNSGNKRPIIPSKSIDKPKKHFLTASILFNLGLLACILWQCSNTTEIDSMVETKLDWYSANGELGKLELCHLFNHEDSSWTRSLQDMGKDLTSDYYALEDSLKNGKIEELEVPFFMYDLMILRNIRLDVKIRRNGHVNFQAFRDTVQANYEKANKKIEKALNDLHVCNSKNCKEYSDFVKDELVPGIQLQYVISLGILYFEMGDKYFNKPPKDRIRQLFQDIDGTYKCNHEKMIQMHPIVEKLLNQNIITW